MKKADVMLFIYSNKRLQYNLHEETITNTRERCGLIADVRILFIVVVGCALFQFANVQTLTADSTEMCA